ncbi:MAG TPA: MFS transporter [Lutibacter sp.]|nr:MFS transporter [Lutibacter sp.]
MTNLQKYTISQVLRTSNWWMAIGVLYFMERGVTIQEFFILSSVFSLCMVILEFPTGVIADKFSHKKSVIIGSSISILSQLAFSVPADFYFYLGAFIVASLGATMKSGSDIAVLHKISNNFEKDLARIKTINFIWIFFTTLVGGWLYTIDIRIPYTLTALTTFVSVLFFVKIKVDSNNKLNRGSNIYQVARKSIKLLGNHERLRGVILLSGGFTAFFFSYKWFLPMLFEAKGISIIHLSTVLAIGILMIALGTALSGSKYYLRLKYSIPVLLLLIFALGFTGGFWSLTIVTLGIYLLRGFFTNRMTVLVNKYAKDSIRASVMSLKSLITRVFMAIYMLMVGKILGIWSFEVLSVVTFAILSIFVLYFVWTVVTSNSQNLKVARRRHVK